MALSGRCTITATLRRFSSGDGENSTSTEYDCDNERFRDYFRVTIYANGSRPENEGHVSIVFNGVRPMYDFFTRTVTFSCTASVIDASGNRRFPQSLALNSEGGLVSIFANFGFDKFVKRSTLLDDPSELLPDDCLTLCLDIDFGITEIQTPPTFPRFGLHKEDDGCYLDADTEFVRDLCHMSPVFQAMMELPMAERETGRIRFPPEEERDFFLIYTFLTGSNLRVDLPDICKLYRFADKYDMQPIVRLCHQLLISLMRAMNTQEILDCVSNEIHILSELAESFPDEILREILAIYSDIKKQFEDGSRILGAYNPIILETEWSCHREGNEFVFRRVKGEPLAMDSLK